MEKYVKELREKYIALDKEAKNKIREFLANSVYNRWNINVEVVLNDGATATLTEVRLVNNKVKFIQSTKDGFGGEMAFGEITKVLSCLPDDGMHSRLNNILMADSHFDINGKLLKTHPYYQKSFGKIIEFHVVNSSLLLRNEQGPINAYSREHEIADFIEYLNDFTLGAEIRAVFLNITANIMENSTADEVWNKYGEQMISEIRDNCGCEHFNDSDVCIAFANILREKLLD